MDKQKKDRDTIKFSIPISKELHAEFVAIAKANDRSGAAAVRDLIREYIDRYKDKDKSRSI